MRHNAFPPIGRPALLVLDVQRYFFDPASRAFLPSGPKVLPAINRLVALAEARGWPVIYTSHRASRRSGNLMRQHWRHLPHGEETRLAEGLLISGQGEPILKEHYSAFMGTGLAAWLKRRKVTGIVLCGAMTHLCVDTTARHGFMLGLRPVVVSDACCSRDGRYHRAALRALAHGFAQVRTVNQLATVARGA